MRKTSASLVLLLIAFVLTAPVLLNPRPGYAQVNLGTSASSTNPQRSGEATTGLFSSTSGAVSVSSSGTEKMRVNGSGVGVGTTSPQMLLHVDAGSAGGYPTYTSSVDKVLLENDSDVYYHALVPATKQAGLEIDTPTTRAIGWFIYKNSTNTWYLGNNSATTVTVDSSGNFGIGTASPQSLLSVAGNAEFGSGDSGTPAAATIRGANASGTNIAGGSLTIQAGLATGNAATGDIVFQGAPAGSTGTTQQTATTYMTIKGGGSSAGNVGIGTTSPSYLLDVAQANSGGTTKSRVYNNATSAGTFAILSLQTGTANALLEMQQGDGANPAGIITAGSGDTNGFVFNAQATGAPVVFQSATTEVMRAVSGKVGIGNASPSYMLHVGSSSASGIVAELQNSSGACTHNPSSGSETVSCSSDMRLKKDIRDTDSALNWVDDLRIRDFTIKATGKRGTGVVAQEVIVKHPEMVHQNVDGLYSVDEPNPWVLLKTIQELHHIVSTQQTQINELNRRLAKSVQPTAVKLPIAPIE